MNDQDEQDMQENGSKPTGLPDEDRTPGGNAVFENSDFVLARAIRELDREMIPDRDLWSGIERNIAEHPQKTSTGNVLNWMPYAVAASFLVAVVSLSVSLGLLNNGGVNQSDVVSANTSLDQMAVEHVQVMNPLMTRFNQVNENLAPETLDDIYRNLEIMSAARRDIEAQVRKNPEDRRLVEMLMRIHEQELELLRQDFSPSGRY